MKVWLVVAALLLVVGCSPSQESENKVMVFGACESQLKQRLNDPGSLEWDHSTTDYAMNDGVASLSREFTAKNGFGGRVKQLMTCTADLNQMKVTRFDIN